MKNNEKIGLYELHRESGTERSNADGRTEPSAQKSRKTSRPSWFPYVLVGIGLAVVLGTVLAIVLGNHCGISVESTLSEHRNSVVNTNDNGALNGDDTTKNDDVEVKADERIVENTSTSVSNLQNGGYVAQVGNTLYFTEEESKGGFPGLGIYYTPRIYRKNMNESEVELIYDSEAEGDSEMVTANIAYLQTIGDRLVFSRKYYDSNNRRTEYSIRSISFDGSDEVELFEVNNEEMYEYGSERLKIQVYDGRIYFTENGILYSINADGADCTRMYDLSSATMWSWIIDDGCIYYQEYKYNDDYTRLTSLIKAVNLEEMSSKTILSTNNNITNFVPYKGCIYYCCFTKPIGTSNSTLQICETAPQIRRFEIKSGEETILMEPDVDSYLPSIVVDDSGVVVKLSHSDQSAKIFTAPIGTDTLTHVYTYDPTPFSSEVHNVGRWSDADLMMFTAIGENIYFIPASDYMQSSDENYSLEERSLFVSSLCSVKRDGNDFSIITNKP